MRRLLKEYRRSAQITAFACLLTVHLPAAAPANLPPLAPPSIKTAPGSPAGGALASFGESYLRIYLAMLVSYGFWTNYDGTLEVNRNWTGEMFGLQRHGALAAFSGGYLLTNAQVERFIPKENVRGRWLGTNVGSVGMGVVAWDVASRALSGRPLDEIRKEMVSTTYAKDLAFYIGAWALTGTIYDLGTNYIAKKHKLKWLECASVLKALGRSVFVIAGTEFVNRTVGEPLRNLGILDRTDMDAMRVIGTKYYAQIQREIDRYRVAKSKNDFVKMEDARRAFQDVVDAYIKELKQFLAEHPDSAFRSVALKEIEKLQGLESSYLPH